METKGWIPKELRQYQTVREALGVLVPLQAKMNPTMYRGYYREKVAALVKKAPDWKEALETYLGARATWYLPEKPEPLEVVDHMEQVGEWRHPSIQLSLLLQGKGSPEAVLDSLNNPRDLLPVSASQFKKELDSLNLWDFLGSVVPRM